MFSLYDRMGVSIAYPENWALEEETSDDANLQLTVSSPNTAFWTLAIYPDLHDPQQLAEQAVEALRAEYADLESSPVEETLHGATLVGCDVNFICLDLTNTARIRVFHRGASTALLFAQAEDREMATAGQVFDAITASLLNGPPSAGAQTDAAL